MREKGWEERARKHARKALILVPLLGTGASEIISVTRHNSGTNHRNGKRENSSFEGHEVI